MRCPHGESSAITERLERTELGYLRFRGRLATRECHERAGTPLSRLP
jgi:hypothetical protein